jgi:hypothetical protein
MGGKPASAMMPNGAPVRLAPGAHSSPHEGVCVVELASVIAGEKFSDRPSCVCPLIGAFLRGWNDRAPHAQRQRLSPYAARIVGSRGNRRVTRQRRDICLEWAGADLSHGVLRRLLTRAGVRIRIAVFCGVSAAVRPNEGAGDYTSRVAAARGDPERAFELLDTLLAVGEEHRPSPRAATANGNGHARVDRNGHARVGRNGLPAMEPHRPATVNGNGSNANGESVHVERIEVSSNGGEQDERSTV